ncbi:MAG: NAD(+)/NADH kinase [Acidobacteria bacterium]|nr:NAD(+)/NADH kinase [Acidobacteriota bacterium]
MREPMKLLVFHNPNAGYDEVPKDLLLTELQRAGHEVVWIQKGGPRKLSDVLTQPFEAVVVVGGDGSVATVGRKLARRGIPIAVLPAGTANNIASLLGATRENLLRLLAGSQTVPFDVGLVDGIGPTRRFLEGVGIGAFAETVAILSAREADAPQLVEDREEELDRDLHVLAELVRRIDPCPCQLEFDGDEVSGEFLMIEVTNAGMIGPNLRLSAGAVPCDGLLDVTLVDVAEREELLTFLGARRQHIERAPPFTIRLARRVRLRLPSGRSLHIDGEAIECNEAVDLRIGIEPAALRFFAEAGAAHRS